MNKDVLLVLITILVALAFDFLNGFHDSANSIATVVSTRVLSPKLAVLWAATFNFLAAFFLGALRIDLVRPERNQPGLVMDAVNLELHANARTGDADDIAESLRPFVALAVGLTSAFSSRERVARLTLLCLASWSNDQPRSTRRSRDASSVSGGALPRRPQRSATQGSRVLFRVL